VLINALFFFPEKGVPAFWLTAMKTNEVLCEEVSKDQQIVLLIFV